MIGLQKHWYHQGMLTWLLRPIGSLFGGLVALRRLAYQNKLFVSHRLPVPVITIGNITVGGTGKTPLVAWMSAFLRQSGYRPGIITRGYKGRAKQWPLMVGPDSDPCQVGDEAVMLARQHAVPVVAGPDRFAAGQLLLAQNDCNVIISDDGLQHYALERDIEIAVVDAKRRFGNGLYLPAGPLREPLSRLETVHMVVGNGRDWTEKYGFTLRLGQAQNLANHGLEQPLEQFRDQTVHAVAGIGDPSRFFSSLESAGLNIIRHPFPDHYRFQSGDLDFGDRLPVLMTEKDAVKCEQFAKSSHWFVPAAVIPTSNLGPDLLQRLDSLREV